MLTDFSNNLLHTITVSQTMFRLRDINEKDIKTLNH